MMRRDLSPTFLLNQALINLMLFEVRRGKWHRCRAFGVTDDVLAKIIALNQEEMERLVFADESWLDIRVNESLFWRLVASRGNRNIEDKITRALRLGASCRLMNYLYKLTFDEITCRRKILGIKTRRGRYEAVTPAQEAKIWRMWLYKTMPLTKTKPLTEAQFWETLFSIAEEMQLPLTLVWRELEKRNVAPKIKFAKEDLTDPDDEVHDAAQPVEPPENSNPVNHHRPAPSAP